MKIYGVNGGPRKGWNTDIMLQHFLAGAASAGADIETEMIYLYDLDYKGCISCFGCHRDNEAAYGRCHLRDDIYDLLYQVPRAGGVVFGCPVYFHDLTAQLRAFMERLLYPFVNHHTDRLQKPSRAPKKLPTAMIYTMNEPQELVKQSDYEAVWGAMENFMLRVFQIQPVRICAYNTYQHQDYSQYRSGFFSVEQKAAYRERQFPLDCQSAYQAGRHLALQALEEQQD